MSQPIQLDPANEKFFLPHVIPFHTPITNNDIVNQQPALLANKPLLVQQPSVAIFKKELHKK